MKKQCPQCHKEFEIEKYLNTTAFCSRRCQRAFNAAKRRKPEPAYFGIINEMIAEARKSGG